MLIMSILIDNICLVFFFRDSWLQRKSVLCLWTCQYTSSSQSWYHETPFWAFTQVCFTFIFSSPCCHQTVWELVTGKLRLLTPSSNFPPWQGHSIWGGQSHDCAECGNCIRPDSASARDGVIQHHHAHGLSEPDSGVHPQWIWACLLLQLKQSQASSEDLGKRLNVLKLFEVLNLLFACTYTAYCNI